MNDVRTVGTSSVEEIRFGDTAAYVVTEARAPDGQPGIVYAHGGTGPGKHIFLWQAIEVARAGFTVILPDTSLDWIGDFDADRRSYEECVLVQRGAIDVLAERGATRLGYFGHSFGGEEGATLASVEPRLDAIVIAAAGTGLVERTRAWSDFDETYLARLEPFDAIHSVRVPGRRRLLFQHGRRDDVIPLAAGRALFEAAAEPKEWREYDCGHGVDGHLPALADRIAFFREALAT